MLGYVKVKLTKLDIYYMNRYLDGAKSNNDDAHYYRVILKLNSVSAGGLITINNDLAESLSAIRSFIVMEQEKKGWIERLFFNLQINNTI